MPPKSKLDLQPSPRDLFPGALEMMILQTLEWQPMHGYALVQHIQQRWKKVRSILRCNEC